MKKITAIVKPFKLEDVLDRLPQEGVLEILVSEVRGYGRQKGHLEMYRGQEYEMTFLPKACLEVYCEDGAFSAVERAILDGARTGRIGDGKLLISAVEHLEAF